MTTAQTAAVARGYFDAWTSGKGPEVMRPLLAEQFVFDAGMHRVEGRENFLAGGGWPAGARTTMVAEGYDGEHAFQVYEARNGDQRIKIAEHLTVRDNQIVSSEAIMDGAAFMAFMSGQAG